MQKAHNRQDKSMSWNSDSEYNGMTIFEAAEKEKMSNGQSRVLGYLPEDKEWKKPNIGEDVSPPKLTKKDKMGYITDPIKLPEHKSFFFYLQRLCNHCSYPACLAACPRKAIYKRDEDGVVLIDQERCRGYRKCVEACPYKKAMYNGQTKISEKCIACYPRLEGRDNHISPDGVSVETRCMSSCVGKIRLQGLVKMEKDGLWMNDNENPLYWIVQKEKVALPLYPQFGTMPNIYYIPPRWAPRAYLTQMFGPGVEHAIDRYTAPSRELMAILQLFRAQQEVIYKFKIKKGDKIYEKVVTLSDGSKTNLDIYNDTVIGYNEKGKECVRTTVEEPMYERPSKHFNSI